ncbi:MAG TPA: zinc ABC transporter substrate-binding protein [Thermohalobaculum sp.]|nr:zinc ABC transporter substrate-binding protein [Thermohalobaculum sp.]
MPRLTGLALALLLGAAPAAHAAPRVVASIPPVHGLVAAVMEGAGAPHLLIPADASPHDFALRPSDAEALAKAELVFVVGAGLEGGLAEAAERLGESAEHVALAEARGVEPLPAVAHEHAEAGHEHAGSGDEDAIDPHLWLDPANAAVWLEAIAAALAEADPANADLYGANAAAAAAELDTLTAELAAALAPYATLDYAVFHDAFRYFERRFGLRPAASLASASGAEPGARGVARFRERLAEMQDPCLFAEPQHDAALVESVARDSGARTGTLDPIGRDIPPGPGFYPELLRALARDLARCLDGAG